MRHSNLDAIVASHQDTILGPAQMSDTYREPYADRQKGQGERESRHIRQHALPIISIVFAVALVAG
jgi:ABC-type dipeptide/oligopeptide/nickel transport system permease component